MSSTFLTQAPEIETLGATLCKTQSVAANPNTVPAFGSLPPAGAEVAQCLTAVSVEVLPVRDGN